MNGSSQNLLEIQFQEIGEWKLSTNRQSIEYTLNNQNILNIPNVLYSFVLKSNEDDLIGYIGKTSKSIKNRFQGYVNPSNDQRTNIRVSKKIKEALEENKNVLIYALFDIEPLQWGIFSINLPAGLEDSIVHKLKPLWNIAGNQGFRIFTSTEELEGNISENKESSTETDEPLTHFRIKLGEAYYNQGFMNPGVRASDFLGGQNEESTLTLPGNIILKSKIDRTANGNNSVRIYFGKDLADWYQKNYTIKDNLIAIVKSGNRIIIE